MDLKKVSKYLSLILRHQPDSIGLAISDQGWADIEEITEKTNKFKLTREMLETVVETNDKKRFQISSDGLKIKANQGHSIKIDLSLEPRKPPDLLLHGTAQRFIKSIFEIGLTKQNRHHVHLSEKQQTAINVGSRHGKPVLLKIDSRQMSFDGYNFFKTENNVWLVDSVPVKYLSDLLD